MIPDAIGEIEGSTRAAIADLGDLDEMQKVHAAIAITLARALDVGARSQIALVARQLQQALSALHLDSPDEVDELAPWQMPDELEVFEPEQWPSFYDWHKARLQWVHDHQASMENGDRGCRPNFFEVMCVDAHHPGNPDPCLHLRKAAEEQELREPYG